MQPLLRCRLIQTGAEADRRLGEKIAHLGAETAVGKFLLMDARQIVALVCRAISKQQDDGGSRQDLLLVIGEGQQFFVQCRIGDDDKTPRLRIIAARRATGGIEQRGQLVSVNSDRRVKMAGRAAFVQQFIEVHNVPCRGLGRASIMRNRLN